MRWRVLSSILIVLVSQLVADSVPILGVANAPKPFSIDSIQTKPEAGPISVVEGDEVVAGVSLVTFRLIGDNRAVLGNNSSARVRGYKDGGTYFYLSKGLIQFDARKQPLAICARDRLYVPSIPGAGEVAIRDNAVEVKMTAGSMLRSGTVACDAKAAPRLLTELGTGAAAGTTAGTAAGTAGAAVTATASAAGVGTAAATVGAIAVAAGTAAGITATIVTSQPPAPESTIVPGQ